MAGLHWADYVVFAVFIVTSLGIGLYHGCTGGKQRTTAEFLMGNRKLHMLPTMVSLLVSYMSAILVLGGTAEVYTRGTLAVIWEIVAKCLGIFLAERILIPWLFPMRMVSACEFLERRYGCKSVRVVGSLLSILNALAYMGVSIYAPSVALEAASGFPSSWSIPIMAAVCVLYTTAGGIKAVVWTDVFQFLIMMAGILAVLIKSILLTQHLNVYEVASNQSRIQWVDFDPNPQTRHTVWGYVFGLSWLWFFLYGTSQASIQRISAVSSMREARWIALLNIPTTALAFGCCYVIGIFVFAFFYDQNCDPLASEIVHSPNQIVVTFVSEVFVNYRGLTGLFIATLYSGGLSSVSSSLNAATANAWEDLMKYRLTVTEQQAAWITKVLVVFYGLLATGVGFIVLYIEGPVVQIAVSLLAASAAPMGTMFLLGGSRFLFEHIEPIGACCGGIAGFAINVWISVGRAFTRGSSPLPPVDISGCVYPFNQTLPKTLSPEAQPIGIDNLYRVSYIWTGPIGVITTTLVTLLVSRIALCFYKPKLIDVSDGLFLSARHMFTFGAESSPKSNLGVDELDKNSKEEKIAQPDNGDQCKITSSNGFSSEKAEETKL